MGTVTDITGNAIPDTRIELLQTTLITNLTDNNEGFEEAEEVIGWAKSDDDGFFQIQVMGGSGLCAMRLISPEYQLYQNDFIISDLDTTKLGAIILRKVENRNSSTVPFQ